MANYLKLFNEHTQYEAFIGGGVEAVETYGKFEKPNVSHCITDGHVHYNPSDYKITGKFTIPSKLLNVVEGEPSSGGGPIKKIAPPMKIIGGGGGTTFTSCYGLDNGIKVTNNPIVTYSDNTEIFDSTIRDKSSDLSTELQEGQQYVEIRFKSYRIDEDTDEIISFKDTYVNPSDGETYYNSSDYEMGAFSGILENGVFTYCYYDGDNSQFVTTPMPKIVHRVVNVFTYDEQTGMYTYEKINANCVYVKKDGDDYADSTNHVYNGTLTVTDNITTYVLLLYIPTNSNTEDLGMFPKSIKIDGEEIKLKDLEVGNNGWYVLEEGVHNIEYLFDFDECFYDFNEMLYTPYLMGVPVESVVLDSRLQGIGEQVFKGCALLNTEERFINKICTIKEYDNRTRRFIDIEPIVMDCEFEDEDDYITYSKFTNNDYYALHDGKVGMHVCEFEQGSEGGGSSIQK